MRTTIIVLAAAVVAALVPALPPQAAAGPAPTRVMIVGDSVTQGYRGDYTWRYFAWKGLQAEGADVDFVGSRSGPFNVDQVTGAWSWDYHGADAYADPDFDQDHSAFFGGMIGSAHNWFYEPIEQTMAASDPDVIMSLWGWNDLHLDDVGPADLVATYRDWIARARAVNPDIDLVIGALPQTWDDEAREFDELLVGLERELTTKRSTIVVAQMEEDYTLAGDTVDHVHPTTQGQRKIAGMMGGALLDLLATRRGPSSQDAVPQPDAPLPVPPAPPGAPEAAVPPVVVTAAGAHPVVPGAPRRVEARSRGGRVVVTWRRSPRAATYAARCGRASRVVAGTRAVLRSEATRCRVRATSSTGASAWVRVRVQRRR